MRGVIALNSCIRTAHTQATAAEKSITNGIQLQSTNAVVDVNTSWIGQGRVHESHKAGGGSLTQPTSKARRPFLNPTTQMGIVHTGLKQERGVLFESHQRVVDRSYTT